MARLPDVPLAPAQQALWRATALLHALGRGLRRHIGLPVQLALRAQGERPERLPPLGQPWVVAVHAAGVDAATLQQALGRWQGELAGDNPVHLKDWQPPQPWLPPAGPGVLAHLTGGDELALRLDGPLPFKRPTASRTYLTPETLAGLVARRVRQLFGDGLPGWPTVQTLALAAPGLEVLCGHWHFVEVRRAGATAHPRLSAAERRRRLAGEAAEGLHAQSHAGCMGTLYLRGPALAVLAPWLELLQDWQLAAPGGVAVWSPHRLLHPAPPAVDPALLTEPDLVQTARETLASHDSLQGEPEPPLEAQSLAWEALQALREPDFQFRPSQAFALPRASGGHRIVERLHPRDLTVQRRLLQLLGPVLDRGFSPASLGYRKGLSRQDAIERVRELLQRGQVWVLEADIEDFFPSIDHALLTDALDRVLPREDVCTRRAVAAALRQPQVLGGAPPQPRLKGVPQGAPLSPLLANLMLDRLDHALEAEFGDALVRYADDFVLLLRTQARAESALAFVQQGLSELRLKLAEDKTGVRHAAEGFSFLGERFDETGQPLSLPRLDSQRKPLVLTDPGLGLSLNGDAVDVRRNGELQQTLPLRRISEILLFGRLFLSTALIQRCATLRIPIAVSLPGGRQILTLVPDNRQFHEVAWTQTRWYHALGEPDRGAIAAALLDAKLAGYSALVQRRRPVDRELLALLTRCRHAIDGCTDVAALRGHEGLAARACFAWLQRQFKPDALPAFNSPRRAREAGDRLNSLLNFGYYLSFTHLNALVRAHGLNPYLGFLHDGLDDYETLVADLQELVRPFVDRLVVQLVNQGLVRAEEFVPVPRGLYLSKPAARRVAQAFERMMSEPAGGRSLREQLLLQVRVLRQYMGLGGPAWWFHLGADEDGLQTLASEAARAEAHGAPPAQADTSGSTAADDVDWADDGAAVRAQPPERDDPFDTEADR